MRTFILAIIASLTLIGSASAATGARTVQVCNKTTVYLRNMPDPKVDLWVYAKVNGKTIKGTDVGKDVWMFGQGVAVLWRYSNTTTQVVTISRLDPGCATVKLSWVY